MDAKAQKSKTGQNDGLSDFSFDDVVQIRALCRDDCADARCFSRSTRSVSRSAAMGAFFRDSSATG